MTALATALEREQYEVAALRLLLGLLVAMHETARAKSRASTTRSHCYASRSAG